MNRIGKVFVGFIGPVLNHAGKSQLRALRSSHPKVNPLPKKKREQYSAYATTGLDYHT